MNPQLERKICDEMRSLNWINFQQKLPGGQVEKDFLPILGADTQLEGNPKFNSVLYSNQTLGEFLEHIRWVILTMGGEKLINEINEIQKSEKKLDDDTKRRIFEPVYTALRSIGYDYWDLN